MAETASSTAPALMSFPLARAYAFHGYMIRREVWKDASLAWLGYWGGLFFYIADGVCRVVEQPSDVDAADMLARDWTVLAPDCLPVEACSCDVNDAGYEIGPEGDPCPLFPFDNPNARMGLAPCGLPPVDPAERIRCGDCDDDQGDPPFDPGVWPELPNVPGGGVPPGGGPPPIVGDPGGAFVGGGFGPGGGAGGGGGGSGGGGGGAGGSEEAKDCSDLSFSDISIDDGDCIPRLADGNGCLRVQGLANIDRNFEGNLNVGPLLDGNARPIGFLTIRVDGRQVVRTTAIPGDKQFWQSGNISLPPGRCLPIHAELWVPTTGCRTTATAELCMPEHCAPEICTTVVSGEVLNKETTPPVKPKEIKIDVGIPKETVGSIDFAASEFTFFAVVRPQNFTGVEQPVVTAWEDASRRFELYMSRLGYWEVRVSTVDSVEVVVFRVLQQFVVGRTDLVSFRYQSGTQELYLNGTLQTSGTSGALKYPSESIATEIKVDPVESPTVLRLMVFDSYLSNTDFADNGQALTEIYQLDIQGEEGTAEQVYPT